MAFGQVLHQEGFEGLHDVVEGRQRAIQEHTALHQSQTHGQAGQSARGDQDPASGHEAKQRAAHSTSVTSVSSLGKN